MQRGQGVSTGVGLGVLSAAAFGTSGSFGSTLLDRGWSPGAAVALRVLIGAGLLTVPALLALRGRWRVLLAGWRSVLAFGLLGVAGAQLAFFSAVQTLSVAVALLIEYSGVLLVVVWVWLRHGTRPTPLTLLGAAVAGVGLVLVLQVLTGATVSGVGVLWGLVAAVGLAGYFVVSAQTDDSVPALVLAWGGLVVGGVTLLVAGLTGVLAFRASTASVSFRGTETSYLVPVLGLGVLAGALAYGSGVLAARRLGATAASFLGLAEVLFAVLVAYLLLGQQLSASQLVGGGLVLAGILLVQLAAARARVGTPSSADVQAVELRA